MKCNRGMTLIEVVISIALLGIISASFISAISTNFSMLTRTKDMTASVYELMQTVELSAQNIREKIQAHNTTGLDEVTITTTFDGKVIKAYRIEESDGNHVMHTLIAANLPVFAVPVAENIEITPSSTLRYGSPTEHVDGGFNITAATLALSLVNDYQWYVSKPDYYIDKRPIPVDEGDSLKFPKFPEDYTIIGGTRGRAISITNLSDFAGRHLIFTVTPAAKSGKMGEMYSSEPLYFSGLPVTSDLELHLDSCFINTNNGAEVRVNLPSPERFLKKWVNLAHPGTNDAVQGIDGNQPLLEDVINKVTPEIWGRTLKKNSANTSMNVSLGSMADLTVLVVAKSNSVYNTNEPIISGDNWRLGKQGDGRLGINVGSVSVKRDEGRDGEWHVLTGIVDSGSTGSLTFKVDNSIITENNTIGSPDTSSISIYWNSTEIAEILIYDKALSASNLSAVESYLFRKYMISGVDYAVSSVSVIPTSAAIAVGESKTLTATVYPSYATNKSVTWGVVGTVGTVATVSESGVVTGLSPGTKTITATSVDGSKQGTCTITVLSPDATVTFDKNGGTMEADPLTITVPRGSSVPALPTPPTKTGHVFKGWNALANGSGTTFTASSTVGSNKTVYAQWQRTFDGIATGKYVSVNGVCFQKASSNRLLVRNNISNIVWSQLTTDTDAYYSTFSGIAWISNAGVFNRAEASALDGSIKDNDTSWWTSESRSTSNAYYINSSGTVANTGKLNALGFRPYITINPTNLFVVSGDGSSSAPFVLEYVNP